MENPPQEYAHSPIKAVCPTAWPDESAIKSWCKLIRPGQKHGWKLKCLILSDWVYEQITHYAGRTVPCLKQERRCIYCEEGRADRWTGYLAVLRDGALGPALLELTPGCTRPLTDWCAKEGSLRAVQICIEREKGNSHAAVEITDLKRWEPRSGTTLMPAFDVKAALWRIWQIKKQEKPAWKNHVLEHQRNRLQEVIDAKIRSDQEFADLPIDKTNGQHVEFRKDT